MLVLYFLLRTHGSMASEGCVPIGALLLRFKRMEEGFYLDRDPIGILHGLWIMADCHSFHGFYMTKQFPKNRRP